MNLQIKYQAYSKFELHSARTTCKITKYKHILYDDGILSTILVLISLWCRVGHHHYK